jgi:mannose/fructose/N-acetylgalactosamine-specific phosphotransferase system component IIB
MEGYMRIDEKLLHGQIAMAWNSKLGPEAIVVANDEVAVNELQKMALKMAKPDGMKLAIKSVGDAITLLKDPQVANIKVLIITKNSRDALQIAQNISGIKWLNVGGMVGSKKSGKMVVPQVYLEESDIANIKQMIPLVGEVDFRIVPTDKNYDVTKVL